MTAGVPLISLCVLLTLLACMLILQRFRRHGASGVLRRAAAPDITVCSLPDAAFLLNAHHTIVECSAAAARLIDSPDPVGQSIVQALAHMPSVVAHCAAMTPARFETAWHGPDHRSYEVTVTPLFDDSGRLTGRLLILHDITERRLAQVRQQALGEAGALLAVPLHAELPLHDVARLMVGQLVDTCGIYLKDADGQIRMFGASRRPRMGLPFDGEEAFDVARAWRPVLDGSMRTVTEADRSELLANATPQAARWLSQLRSFVCVPLRAHEHTYGALLLAATDGARVLSAHDRDMAEALAQQIATAVDNHHLFMTLQASEARHREASAEAERASVAKSTFLTMMSHEIRTPLMGVLGIADLLGRTNVQHEQKELLNILVRNAHSLRTTIADMLDIARIETGKLDLVQEPVDLVQCVEDAINTVAFQASEKGLDLTYQFAANVPGVILADYVRLRQILMNVLSNAVKFTEHGAVTIRIMSDGPSSSEHGSEVIRFAVQDTGIGIAPEHCAHLFDAFYQGHPESKQRYGGSGIGLTISRQLCELMGGTIDVTSSPGAGSTFTFTIAAAALPNVQPGMPLHTVPLLSNRHMLIVGASAAEQTMLTTQAQHWGMRVHAATIAEALGALRAGIRHDIIVAGSDMVEHAPSTVIEIHRLAAIEPEHPIITLLPLTHVWSEAYAVPDNMVVQTCPIKLSAFYETLIRLVQPSGTSAAPTLAAAATARTPLRMLIVDDNQTNCMLMQHMLSAAGYHADAMTNGDAALRAMQHIPYDIVWLDIHMAGSGLDGLDVVQQFNKSHAPASPYMVAVTASATVQDRERCLAGGMHDYLCKPIDQAQLEAIIARACAWLRQQPARAVNAPSDRRHESAGQSWPNARTLQHGAAVPTVKTPSGYTLPEFIVTTFFEEADEMLLALRRAMAAGDAGQICATLHRLKSSSRYIAGAQMAQRCQLFEDLVHLGDRTHWEEAMCELEEAFSQACQIMEHAGRAGAQRVHAHTSALHAQTRSCIPGD
jgi:signal transduction histidine kinase/CheY-like chemotaxis protein/HPt (histidine-containing phosphotransfer) domain-containing protein